MGWNVIVPDTTFYLRHVTHKSMYSFSIGHVVADQHVMQLPGTWYSLCLKYFWSSSCLLSGLYFRFVGRDVIIFHWKHSHRDLADIMTDLHNYDINFITQGEKSIVVGETFVFLDSQRVLNLMLTSLSFFLPKTLGQSALHFHRKCSS